MTNPAEPKPIVPEVLDVTKICATFPRSTGIQIPRDNLYHILETILDGDVQVLGIEGADGIGKTTLLAQFATRHLNKCVSMFVAPTSRLACDPTLLRADICNQMHWISRGEEIAPADAGDPSLYQQLVMELQRRARRPEQAFYFVVDGLEGLLPNLAEIHGLIGLLPMGLPQFRFLFSGNVEEILKSTKRRQIHKGVPIPGFTLDETIRFFSDITISEEHVSEVYLRLQRACQRDWPR